MPPLVRWLDLSAGYYWQRPSHYHTLMPLVSDWTTPLIFSAFTLLTVSVLDVYHTLMPLVRPLAPAIFSLYTYSELLVPWTIKQEQYLRVYLVGEYCTRLLVVVV